MVVWDVFVFVGFPIIAWAVWWGVYPDVGSDGCVADVWTGGVVAAMTEVVGMVSETVPWGVTGAGVDVVVDADGEVGGGHSEEGGKQREGLQLHLVGEGMGELVR